MFLKIVDGSLVVKFAPLLKCKEIAENMSKMLCFFWGVIPLGLYLPRTERNVVFFMFLLTPESRARRDLGASFAE